MENHNFINTYKYRGINKMIKNRQTDSWSTVEPQVLHQARIRKDIKQKIKTLSIIEGKSISAITEKAINNYVDSNSKLIQQYHQEQSRGVR